MCLLDEANAESILSVSLSPRRHCLCARFVTVRQMRWLPLLADVYSRFLSHALFDLLCATRIWYSSDFDGF